MYEVAKFIGAGAMSSFFRIRNQPHLGVKIMHFHQSDGILQNELQIGRILRELGISVPEYYEVAQVLVPSHFQETIGKQLKWMTDENEIENIKDKTGIIQPGSIRNGLIMERIENDLSLVGKKHIEYLYKKERNKIESFGIKLDDEHLDNVLWSPSTGKIYFIDFLFWNIPETFTSLH